MNKYDTLKNVRVGARVAEEEVDDIINYFVETNHWNMVYNGEIDVIYGAKGSGKSAIYTLLNQSEDDLFGKNILLAQAENPRGATIFRGLVSNPPPTEKSFVFLWKLYFVVIVCQRVRDWGLRNEKVDSVLNVMSQMGLVTESNSIAIAFRNVVSYFQKILAREPAATEWSFELDSNTGMPKVVRRAEFDRSSDGIGENFETLPVFDLFMVLDEGLKEEGYKVWICLDRLDVAFEDNSDLEKNALRALFRVYVDCLSLSNISFKIFVREDIRQRITEGGFREASHITRTITLEWEDNDLLNLIARRLVQNHALVEYLNLNIQDVLSDFQHQQELMNRILPDQVDIGRNPKTFKWMLSRIQDGSRKSSPRELIHLFDCTRMVQIRRFERGEVELEGELLFERVSFKEGLKEVSKIRYEQTLISEYPSYKEYLEKLRGEKTEQTLQSLATIWKKSDEKARKIVSDLIDMGFFEQRGNVADGPTYWVPFIYRDALDLVQGKSE